MKTIWFALVCMLTPFVIGCGPSKDTAKAARVEMLKSDIRVLHYAPDLMASPTIIVSDVAPGLLARGMVPAPERLCPICGDVSALTGVAVYNCSDTRGAHMHWICDLCGLWFATRPAGDQQRVVLRRIGRVL